MCAGAGSRGGGDGDGDWKREEGWSEVFDSNVYISFLMVEVGCREKGGVIDGDGA